MILRTIQMLALIAGGLSLPSSADEPPPSAECTVDNVAEFTGAPSAQWSADAQSELAPGISASQAGSQINTDLARQIEEVRERLDNARGNATSESQLQSLDITRELLEVTRARLLDPSVPDDRVQTLISAAMDRAQQRIDELRIGVRRSPDNEQLNTRLDQMQNSLDLAQQRMATPPSGATQDPLGQEHLDRIYALAQQRLNEAYARAATLPNSTHLIEQLDTAQRRLNQARAGIGGYNGPSGN